ncbi:MAG: DUF4388 domain-containing protein [candidate division Zixibacteria bacterium]|nr:DUF4388 domain-containing protein [candidate division Zixibacteria bacterium]
MTKPDTKKIRLDQILLQEGLISEEQIKEALLRQKARGGKFGSQLLYHRYIDEAGLIKALSIQFNCEGIVLSKLEIPEIITGLIPSKVAISRRVIPFDYDPEENILKVACEDPADKSLVDELNFVARGKKVKLYVAAELALNTAVAKYYLGRDTKLDDNLLLEIPDAATDTGKIETGSEALSDAEETAKRRILLVTDEEYAGPLVQSLLERDNFEVIIVDSADQAIATIDGQKFHAIFVKDTVSGDYIDLIDQVRKISPRTIVRYYESVSTLLLSEDILVNEEELFTKNLDLFTSVLSYKEKLPTNHSGTVGRYADILCRKLGLPAKDRLTIATAGYIHDLAGFYYGENDPMDYRGSIESTAKLLESLGYSPLIIQMLRSMYKDVSGKYTKRLPIEVLGGNILTAIDLFCANISITQRLSLDKFDTIKKKFRDQVGRLFLPEVVEAFIRMIQEEILNLQTSASIGQVMIYSDRQETLLPIELRLKNDGFRTISESSLDSFVELYQRSQPDILILLLHDQPSEIAVRVENISNRGIEIKKIPTFLLIEGSPTSVSAAIFEKGIEDVISIGANPDFLIMKMRRIMAQLESKTRQMNDSLSESSGAKGQLADMNLIDLLQALGPSLKTVKIIIKLTALAENKLELFLSSGRIIFARLNDKIGADAVYEAISWTDGSWVIEPMAVENLPEPNNELSNEAILIEGCRLWDEKLKSGQLFSDIPAA